MPGQVIVAGVARPLHGWVPDKRDHRDVRFYGMGSPKPSKVDLRPSWVPILDQSTLGSCVAHGCLESTEFLFKKAGRQIPALSRLFLYYMGRVAVENRPATEDGGMPIRSGIKALATYGACMESSWPYDIGRFAEEPPANCNAEALNHKIISYYRIPNLDLLRQCLADGFPVVLGFAVPESIQRPEVAASGVVPFPGANERIEGGHCISIVGYDDAKQLLTFANSWSTSWGELGFGYLPYAFVTNWLASDMWTVRATSDL